MSTKKKVSDLPPANPAPILFLSMDPERTQRIIKALQSLTTPMVDKTQLLEAIQALDAEIASPQSGLPADLDHYLRRRSYEKALVYLQGGKPGAGTCGRGQ